jgi:hypothetical protein
LYHKLLLDSRIINKSINNILLPRLDFFAPPIIGMTHEKENIMKKTLLSLLTTVAFTAPTFAASVTAEPNANAAGEPNTVTIKEKIVPKYECGIEIPLLHYDAHTGNFKGAPREFIVAPRDKIVLNCEKDTFIQITMKDLTTTCKASEAFQYELRKSGLKSFHDSDNFYRALCIAVSCITQDNLPHSILFQLRQITASIFPEAPNAWMMGDLDKLPAHARSNLTGPALEKYHLPTLTAALRSKLVDYPIDENTINSIAKNTYVTNAASSHCPKDIKAVFRGLSQILAIAAYNCRIQNISPTTIFTADSLFSPEVSALITMLFELDDKLQEDPKPLKILGAECLITGLPDLTEVQKDFATRWLETVLSPSVISAKAFDFTEQDGFALIPEVVERVMQLWTEYESYVFGKTVNVIFSCKNPSTEAGKE